MYAASIGAVTVWCFDTVTRVTSSRRVHPVFFVGAGAVTVRCFWTVWIQLFRYTLIYLEFQFQIDLSHDLCYKILSLSILYTLNSIIFFLILLEI